LELYEPIEQDRFSEVVPHETRGNSPNQKIPDVPLSDWESQRANFSLETLNALACKYNSIPVDGNGIRTISAREFVILSQEVLKVPAAVTIDMLRLRGLMSEATASSKAERAVEGVLVLRTLLDLLEPAHSATAHMARYHSELFWTGHEMEHMTGAFKNYSNGQGCIRMGNLFSLIRDIGIDCLNVDCTEHQQFVVDVVRRTQGDSSGSRKTSKYGGMLSFEHFLVILAVSVHERRIVARRKALLCEQNARRKAEFSFTEIEDLRELHSVFLAQTSDVGDDATSKKHEHKVIDRLGSMLQTCGVRCLADSEKKVLRNVIPENLSRDDEVSFGKFVSWMEVVFANCLGGLQRQANPTSGPPETGFVATLLRECPEAQKKTHGESTFEAGDTATELIPEASASSGAENSVSRSSSVVPPKRRQPNKRKTLQRQLTRSNSRTMEDKRTAKGPTKRAGSTCSFSTSNGEAPQKNSAEACTSNDTFDVPEVLNLKGLPPSEAMLARREMRAISVDFDPAALQHLPGVGRSDYAVGSETTPLKLEQLTVGQPLERKVKPALDSHVVVRGAIERLAHSIAFDSDVEDAES
jgi:hypothetical protein